MRKVVVVAVLVVAVVAVLVTVRLQRTGGHARRVERARVIAAPPDAVLAELVDLRRWVAWAPWEGDAIRARVYGGPPAGTGASCYWSDARGEAGRLTVDAVLADGLDLELEQRGWLPADLELRLTPVPTGTRVSWSHTVEPDLFARARAFVGVEAPAAALLERGLARLEAVLAARPRVETFRVERSARVRAQPAALLARLGDVRSFASWSPWDAPGRRVERSYGGPSAGVGASAYWAEQDHPDARARVTVTRVTGSVVELELERGGASTDHALTVVPDEEGARVSWTVSGEATPGAAPPVAALAADLDRGLVRLRALVEDDRGAGRLARKVRP